MKDFPLGALINAQESCRRLIDFYKFECEAGPLRNCGDMQYLQFCLERIFDYVQHNTGEE